MSQRNSGYQRIDADAYATPAWVTEALIPHLPRRPVLTWEPAAGSGKMAAALPGRVVATDIETSDDFLLTESAPDGCDAIISNPPYALATEFIDWALCLMEPCAGIVVMLLRTDFDHAKSRQYLFSECEAFAKKLVLVQRIRWFTDSTGSPSFNHAWFIWDWQNRGPPTLAYGP